MGQSVQIEMRPYPLVRLNTWLWKKCLSSIPEAALPYIPGTRQFQRKCQTQVAQETRKGLQLFKDLQALDTTTKRSLFFQMRTHENRRAIMFIRQGYAALVGLLVPCLGYL
jgi:hypothetical protein